MQVDPPVTPWDEPRDPLVIPQDLAPQKFVDAGNEYRLVQELRGRAKFRNPTVILAHSAAEFFNAQRAQAPDEKRAATDLGTAIADLAVTGRQTYNQFKNGISMLSLEGTLRQRLDAQQLPVRPSDAEIQAAMDQALDRAYNVAWALRGALAQRDALRAPLGWIAVSAEDDTPHRPVNMPAPPFEQYEVHVRTPIAGGEVALWTRFFVACADNAPSATVPVQPRKAPDDPVPFIPAYHELLLFVHGHSSGAEEALDLIPHLLQEGLRQGRRYAVMSFDLPNNGYSETFDHPGIWAPDATSFPTLTNRNAPIATPILDFIEDFIVAFVDAVEDAAIRNGTPRIKHRIAAVIGGSLGGNLGLRLGRRKEMPPWLRTVVSWSPASVWKAMVRDHPGRDGSRDTWVEFQDPEVEDSRRQFFSSVYDAVRLPGVIGPQPEYWYGESFVMARLYIQFSRLARREIYNKLYRQWHWRVACEQLIYSHFENEVYGDNSTPVRYTQNTVRTLLAAGEEDDEPKVVNIYDGTRKLGESMVGTPGRRLLIRNTGHSIHAERPQFLASEIVKFLREGPAWELSSSAVDAVFALLLDDADRNRTDSTAATAAIATLLLDGSPP